MISFAKVTKSEYGQLTPVTDRIYFLTDTGEQYLNGSPYSPDQPAVETQLDAIATGIKAKMHREPVCITALNDDVDVRAYVASAGYSYNIEVSTDQVTWTTVTVNVNGSSGGNTLATLAHTGDKVYLRGNNPDLYNFRLCCAWATQDKQCHGNLSGDLMSLLQGDSFLQSDFCPDYGFYRMNLWQTKMGQLDYDGAYLHVDTLGINALQMFASSNCFAHLPDITANHLCSGAMGGAFQGSHSTVTAYDFKITNDLAQCSQLFSGCSTLNDLMVHFTSWPDGGITDWLKNVSATGTFRCPTALDTTNRGASYIPDGWTIVRID